MSRFSSTVTNIFLILLIIQFTPALIRTIKTTYTDILEPKTKVGIISMKGTLNDSTQYAKELKKLFENNDVKAIVLKMDCPGGSAGASQALFYEVKELKKRHLKPVITWVQNVCASGGYYIASATDHIISTPSAFVGSIGAYIPQPQLKKFIEQFKIEYSDISAGAYKTAGNPLLDLTSDQAKMLKGLVDDTYHQFTADVAGQRSKLSLNNVKQWADGKIFTGKQALELGLIDEIGSQSTVEHYIKQKAHIEGAIAWVRPACKSNFMKLISGDCDDESDNDSSYITSFVNALCNWAEQKFSCAHCAMNC